MEYTIEVHIPTMRKFIELDNICTKCPVDIAHRKIGKERDILNNGYSKPEARHPICKMCQEFVFVTKPICPCWFYNCANGAITMANYALALWDAGQHPMQEKYDGEPDGL